MEKLKDMVQTEQSFYSRWSKWILESGKTSENIYEISNLKKHPYKNKKQKKNKKLLVFQSTSDKHQDISYILLPMSTASSMRKPRVCSRVPKSEIRDERMVLPSVPLKAHMVRTKTTKIDWCNSTNKPLKLCYGKT